MLAVEASELRLIGLALVSMALAAVVLFYSDFRSARRFSPSDGVLAAIFGSVITYAIALVASALAVPKPRKRTRPSRAAKAARLEAKRRRSALKRDRRQPRHEE